MLVQKGSATAISIYLTLCFAISPVAYPHILSLLSAMGVPSNCLVNLCNSSKYDLYMNCISCAVHEFDLCIVLHLGDNRAVELAMDSMGAVA